MKRVEKAHSARRQGRIRPLLSAAARGSCRLQIQLPAPGFLNPRKLQRWRNGGLRRSVAGNVSLALLVHRERLARVTTAQRCRCCQAWRGRPLRRHLWPPPRARAHGTLRNHLLGSEEAPAPMGDGQTPIDAHLASDGSPGDASSQLHSVVEYACPRPATKREAPSPAETNANSALRAFPACSAERPPGA